jgi:hypothetical protein
VRVYVCVLRLNSDEELGITDLQPTTWVHRLSSGGLKDPSTYVQRPLNISNLWCKGKCTIAPQSSLFFLFSGVNRMWIKEAA